MSTTVHNLTAKSAPEVRSEQLDSWKQIAVYLRREVRTVQRWEKSEGLPVHRHYHVKGGTVYALKEEIDVWLAGRAQPPRESRPMQKRSQHAANGLNPSPYMIRQMVAAIRLWLAIVAQESRQDYADADVADTRMILGARQNFAEIQESQHNARARQVVTHRERRALSLASR